MKTSALLIGALIAGSFAMNAEVVTPMAFSDDFQEMGKVSPVPTDGWITYGVDATPAANMKDIFANAGESSYAFYEFQGLYLPLSCTNFDPATQADQWLVTPEFEMPYDASVLSFSTVFFCNSGTWGRGSVPYEVRVSDSGASKENFTTVVADGEETFALTQPMKISSKRALLNGYGGKKIRLAFIQKGQDVGPFGFAGIEIANYMTEIQNMTPAVFMKGEKVSVDVNFGVVVPVDITKVNAALEIDGEKVGEKSVNRKTSANFKNVLFARVNFNNLDLTMGDKSMNYRLTVTPDFEGAQPTVITGVLSCPVTSYVNNVLVEELTSTGCPSCPPGTAALEAYHDLYPGTADQGKVILVAGHYPQINWFDPMSEGVLDYIGACQLANGSNTNIPQTRFNRSTIGAQPWYRSYVDKGVDAKSYNKVDISAVEYPVLSNPDDIYGSKINVKFDLRNAFDADNLGFRFCVIMVEDDVEGFESGYNQGNAFYNREKEYISSAYGESGYCSGEWLVPYMEKYLHGGSLGVQTIGFDKIRYQHVARGCWPDYEGEAISGSWRGDVPQSYSYEVEVPENVLVWENTKVIVAVMDSEGAVVACDEMPQAKFTETAAVDGIAADSAVSIVRNGNILEVSAPTATPVALYAADGTLLYSGLCTGTLSLDMTAHSGLILVRAGSRSAKLLF